MDKELLIAGYVFRFGMVFLASVLIVQLTI